MSIQSERKANEIWFDESRFATDKRPWFGQLPRTDRTVAYYNVDLINPASVSRPSIRSLGDMYVGMLDDSQASLRQVFALLAVGTEEATVYRCAAGKDRTGVVSGILLDLAGVPVETIVNDYSLTAEMHRPDYGRAAPRQTGLRAG